VGFLVPQAAKEAGHIAAQLDAAVEVLAVAQHGPWSLADLGRWIVEKGYASLVAGGQSLSRREIDQSVLS
jgi:hypothetical protein